MEIVRQFFDFEIRYGLFDFVDQYGLRPWEAVRGDVMESVMYQSDNIEVTRLENNSKRFSWRRLVRLFHLCSFVLGHRNCEYMFFLCSRDQKGELSYDKVSDSLYALVDKRNCFTIESHSYSKEKYKYGSDIIPNYSRMLTRIKRYNFDFKEIYRLLKQEFPYSNVTLEKLNGYYNIFVCDYMFYKTLFKICHIKKVFMVQNGLQKGMFAAANELGVKVMELQHGQISFNHVAYSYPDSQDIPSSKIYHPDYLLTFGTFWTRKRCYPGVENVVIGNDSYAEVIETPDVCGNRKLLVISNNFEGKLLADRVEEVLVKDPSFTFIFKLHPNQYHEYETYKARFDNNSQVEVVSNQQTINQLLAQCEGIFLNQSTVELEALRMGRKVFILAEQFFEAMDFVFDEKGVYLCKNVDEFLAVYEKNKDVRLTPRDDLFVRFDESVARKMLQL